MTCLTNVARKLKCNFILVKSWSILSLDFRVSLFSIKFKQYSKIDWNEWEKILFNFLHNLFRVDKVWWKGKKVIRKLVAQEVINGYFKRVSNIFYLQKKRKNSNELSIWECPHPFRCLEKVASVSFFGGVFVGAYLHYPKFLGS